MKMYNSFFIFALSFSTVSCMEFDKKPFVLIKQIINRENPDVSREQGKLTAALAQVGTSWLQNSQNVELLNSLEKTVDQKITEKTFQEIDRSSVDKSKVAQSLFSFLLGGFVYYLSLRFGWLRESNRITPYQAGLIAPIVDQFPGYAFEKFTKGLSTLFYAIDLNHEKRTMQKLAHYHMCLKLIKAKKEQLQQN